MRAEMLRPARRAEPARRSTLGLAEVSALPGRTDKDAELMWRVKAERDRSAFSELAEHYAPRLVAWLINRGESRPTAEDIVQDVLVAVWRKASLFDENKASFSAWVFRATRNKWIDHQRRHGRVLPVEPDLMNALADAPQDSAEKGVERAQAIDALRQELALLPPEQKQMLFLAFFEGLSHSQIAARTGVALGTVKSRIRAPLMNLRVKLGKFEGAGQ